MDMDILPTDLFVHLPWLCYLARFGFVSPENVFKIEGLLILYPKKNSNNNPLQGTPQKPSCVSLNSRTGHTPLLS